MSSMTENQRSQLSRYDLQETRPRLTEVSERGTRILAGLTVFFVAVLGVLTFAAVQIFDGWHHLIVIADLALVLLAVAAWVYSMRPTSETESDTAFVPAGMRRAKKS